jgi:5-methyltetrahydropteroyltriglutamate--homocysteine methyltransferase
MPIPTEPIGSIPRPPELIDALGSFAQGKLGAAELALITENALSDTVHRFEQTGSPVITDGEQTKSSFVTYPLEGMPGLASDGVVISFSDDHQRQLPRLAEGPFRYRKFADEYLKKAKSLSNLPVKQAVISASALSLLYQRDVPGYAKEQFVDDLVSQAEADIRRCLDAGAYCVQIDFTEARLSLKLDPSGGLLQSFIDLNNHVLSRFSAAEHERIGVHTCAGSDQDASHSASVGYEDLLPLLLTLQASRFYIQLAAEPDRARVLKLIKAQIQPHQLIFVGVTDPTDPQVETVAEVKERVLEAVSYIPAAQLGTTDDCGFSPFADDRSTSRDIAFAKIAARVEGTKLAEKALGLA